MAIPNLRDLVTFFCQIIWAGAGLSQINGSKVCGENWFSWVWYCVQSAAVDSNCAWTSFPIKSVVWATIAQFVFAQMSASDSMVCWNKRGHQVRGFITRLCQWKLAVNVFWIIKAELVFWICLYRKYVIAVDYWDFPTHLHNTGVWYTHCK